MSPMKLLTISADSGSNPGGIITCARRDGDSWVLNGVKRWSTNIDIAHLALVRAKDEGDIYG